MSHFFFNIGLECFQNLYNAMQTMIRGSMVSYWPWSVLCHNIVAYIRYLSLEKVDLFHGMEVLFPEYFLNIQCINVRLMWIC